MSDIRHLGLDKEPVDEVYGSFAQSRQAAMSVVIRSSQTSPELGQQLGWIAHDIDPNAVVAECVRWCECARNGSHRGARPRCS